MNILKRFPAFLGALLLGVAITAAAVDYADARSGGGFGSRGGRTYTAPSSTTTAPSAAQPIQRSMTPAPTQAANAATAGRGGLFGGGLGGSLLRGLAIGGLVGMLFGGGFGGMAGFLGLLVQAALIAGVVMLALRFFANRRQSAPAPAAAGAPYGMNRESMFGGAPGGSGSGPTGRSALGGLGGGLGNGNAGGNVGGTPYQPAPARRVKDEIGIGEKDFEGFERLLREVQDNFAREDYDGLRQRTTPEVMSYLSEELSQNATRGVINRVSDVKLLQGDLSEAWREGGTEYATVAMRYEMRDTLHDRQTGVLASDSIDKMTETTEIWTFTRPRGGEWKLSAIQDV